MRWPRWSSHAQHLRWAGGTGRAAGGGAPGGGGDGGGLRPVRGAAAGGAALHGVPRRPPPAVRPVPGAPLLVHDARRASGSCRILMSTGSCSGGQLSLQIHSFGNGIVRDLGPQNARAQCRCCKLHPACILMSGWCRSRSAARPRHGCCQQSVRTQRCLKRAGTHRVCADCRVSTLWMRCHLSFAPNHVRGISCVSAARFQCFRSGATPPTLQSATRLAEFHFCSELVC